MLTHTVTLVLTDLQISLLDVPNLVPIISSYVLSSDGYKYAELLCWAHRPSWFDLQALVCNHKPVEELQLAGYTLHPSITDKRYQKLKERLDYRVFSDLAYAFYSSSPNFPVQPYMNRPPSSGYIPLSAFIDLGTYEDADEVKTVYSSSRANSLLRQAKKETRQEYRARDAYQRFCRKRK